MSTDDRWLTTAEAAARLDVADSTVHRFAELGRLEARRPGRGYLFTEASVDAVATERSRWLSHERAAELVGIAPRVITRAVARGELHPRDVDHSVPSLSRDEVVEWAEARRQGKAGREARRREQHERTQPPDTDHVWLDTITVAIMLRKTPNRVRQLARAERLPYTRRGDRYWFVREHIEQVSAARALRGG